MKNFLDKFFNHGKNLLQTFTPKDKEKLEEIKKLEKQIQEYKKEESKTQSGVLITNRHMVKFWLVGLLVVFLGYICFMSLDIIYLIIAAYIISIAIEAIVDIFQNLKLGRNTSIALAYIFLIVFVLSGFVLIIPFMTNQMYDIANVFIAKMNALQSAIQTQGLTQMLQSSNFLPGNIKQDVFHNFTDPKIMSDVQLKIQDSLAQISSMWTKYAQLLGNMAVNFATGFATFLTKAGIVLTLSILFSIEKLSVIKFIASLGGEKKYKYIYIKLEKIYKQLGIWLKSRLLLSLYIGITMYVCLLLLSLFGMNIGHKASLALILGLLDIVPYIGPVAGGVPGIITAMMGYGIWGGVVILGIITFINFIENNVLIPLLMNKTLGVNPVVIFISMILGGMIMGFTGIVLAVPIAAIITLLFEKE